MRLSDCIPDELRLKLVEKLLTKIKIKHLADSIGVHHKAILKYRAHESCPSDEIFARIFSFAEINEPELYREFVKNFFVKLDDAKSMPLAPIKTIPPSHRIGRPKVTLPPPVTEGHTIRIAGNRPKEPEAAAQIKPTVRPKVTEPKVAEVLYDLALEKLTPQGLVQRAAWGELLAYAMMLQSFSARQLSAKTHYPESLTKEFCEKLVKQDFATRTGETLSLKVRIRR